MVVGNHGCAISWFITPTFVMLRTIVLNKCRSLAFLSCISEYILHESGSPNLLKYQPISQYRSLNKVELWITADTLSS
jgi:hypothetical protein